MADTFGLRPNARMGVGVQVPPRVQLQGRYD